MNETGRIIWARKHRHRQTPHVLFYLLIIYSIISILPSCFFPTSISFNFRTISQNKAWLFPFHNWGRIYSDHLLHIFKAVTVPCGYYLFLKKQGQQIVGGKGFRLHGLHNFLWVFHSVLNKNLHTPLKIGFSIILVCHGPLYSSVHSFPSLVVWIRVAR